MIDLSELILRPHRPEDYPQLARLRWALRTEEDAGPEPPQDLRQYIRRYADWLTATDRRGDTVHMVAEAPSAAEGQTLQAVMTLRTVPKEPCPYQFGTNAEGRSIGYLTNCYVAPDWRNAGLGSALLQRAIETARTEGMELIFVWPSERAVDFYLRTGFKGGSSPLIYEL